MRIFDQPGRSHVIAENGMAATSHPLATASALQVLREGGNAVDAAIAAAATLAVVEPHMTGIGGDCFVILAEPNGTLHGLNGSGRAPAAADAGKLRDQGFDAIPASGALSVTAPGAVKAWETLAERFGTLDFDRLFADAVRYAEDGFAVHPRVARDWSLHAAALAADEGGAMHYLDGGRAPAVGTRWRLPALGQTLRSIAEGGSQAFYTGALAEEMVATLRKGGNDFTQDDLAGVEADWIDPVSTSYGGHDVFELPPNGQGVTALILLNLLTRLKAGGLGADSVERYHLEIEAGRLAYTVRDHLVADPDTMTVSLETLLSQAYTKALADQFDPEARNPSLTLPEGPDADTVYLTVVDRDRRAVSFINSLYGAFGSKVVTPRSGVALQNRAACFSLAAGHPNEYGPGKRPMHTIIPGMLKKDGRVAGVFGVMGGQFQPMGHAHLLSNLFDHGMDPQAALDHGRVFWDKEGAIEAEAGVPLRVVARLQEMGHDIRPATSPHGGGQIILIDHENGFLVGGSDPRKDGLALGW